MSNQLHKDWFERLQINMQQAPDGFVGIHAWKKGETCSYFEVPLEWVYLPDFWARVHEKALEAWKKAVPIHGTPKCPICGRNHLPFHLRYKGKMFCRWCGSHFYIDKRGRIVVTKENDGKDV